MTMTSIAGTIATTEMTAAPSPTTGQMVPPCTPAESTSPKSGVSVPTVSTIEAATHASR